MEVESEDRVISEFLQSIGPWREVVVIGGGYALIIYKLYLADQQLKNLPVGTRDIDSLIPRKVPELSRKNIAKHLQEAGFKLIFKDLEQPATESFVKEIGEIEVEVEFLTDSATRLNKHKNVLISGVVAQPLSYLNLSLQKSREFKTYSGKLGQVVSPGAWLFHKGLTFVRRKSISKSHKDLYGIWYVATQLGEFSNAAIAELHLLGSKQPKWYKTFQGNLWKWLGNVSPLEWTKLEAQDPLGRLKRLHFEEVLNKIVSS